MPFKPSPYGTTKWSFNVPAETDLFFRRLVLDRGWMQHILGGFVDAFMKECQKASIVPDFNLENEDNLAKILDRMWEPTPPVQAVPQPKPKAKAPPKA
jgi:hypothetical protein